VKRSDQPAWHQNRSRLVVEDTSSIVLQRRRRYAVLKTVFMSLGGTYPFRIGGPSVVAYNLIKQFDRKGLEVKFVYGTSKQHYEERCRQPLFSFSQNIHLVPVIKNRRSPASYATSFDANFVTDIIRLAHKMLGNADLVHFCDIPSSRDILLPPLAWAKRIPSIFNLHGWIAHEARSKGDFHTYESYFCYKVLKGFFTRVVCSTFFMRQQAILDGVDSQKICIIPNGVELDRFRKIRKIQLTGDPALLFVGRLEPEKGIDMLVEGMKDVVKSLPRAVLHVVGDGSLSSELKSLTMSANLEKSVIFYGKVLDVVPFYQSADICVFPSVYENFALTIIEAMAAGKPLVATKCGGIPEYVRNFENGLLTRRGKESLVKAITDLWNDKGLMKKIGENNLEKAEELDWARIAERYIRLYRTVA